MVKVIKTSLIIVSVSILGVVGCIDGSSDRVEVYDGTEIGYIDSSSSEDILVNDSIKRK